MEQLTVTEAAKYAGVGASTVRRWIDQKRITAERNKFGNWEVEKESLLQWLAQQPPAAHAPLLSSQSNPDTDTLRLALQHEHETLERERRIADDLRAELREARAECRALQAEMRALLTGGLQEAVSRWVRVQPEEKPHDKPEQTHQESQEEEPKTDFGKQCYQLFKEDKTDEEIAETLHKPVQNVKMALRKYRHSA